MREFLFPDGRAWVLVRYLPGGKTQLTMLGTDVGQAVPLFSDDDLARTYAEAGGASGYIPTVLDGPEEVITFLIAQQKCGVVYVALDPQRGRESEFMTQIEKVIEHVRKPGTK